MEWFFIKLWKIDTNQEYGIHITDYGLDIETWIWIIDFIQESVSYNHDEGCYYIITPDPITIEYKNKSDKDNFIKMFLSIENKYNIKWSNS